MSQKILTESEFIAKYSSLSDAERAAIIAVVDALFASDKERKKKQGGTQ